MDGYKIFIPIPRSSKTRFWGWVRNYRTPSIINIAIGCLDCWELFATMQTEALLGKHFGYIDELENCAKMQKDSDRWFIATRDRCPVHPLFKAEYYVSNFRV